MLKVLSTTDSFQNLRDFVRAILWSQKRYVPANDLVGGIAINSFGSPIPCGHGAVEVLTDDGVFGGVDDGSQAGAILANFLRGPASEFFVRPAKFPFDSLAVTDIAYRAQHNGAVSQGERAQADLDVEL
jgi:hypothetical protein